MLNPGLAAAVALTGAACFSLLETKGAERRFAPSGKFATLPGGGRLHYGERLPAGRARGAVLLIHGASGNHADLLLPLGDALAARGFRVIAFDRPGLGWSDRPGGALDADPHRQAELLRDAARAIGVEQAIVLGHSLAGAICADMAATQPDFVRGLVLLSPVTHPWPGGVAWYYHVSAVPVLGWLFARSVVAPIGLLTISRVLKAVFSPNPIPDGYIDRAGARLVLAPERFRANAQDVLALRGFVKDLGPALTRISAPTAIITGDQDQVVSPTLHSLAAARAIAQAELITLPGVGHSPHWAQPEAVVDALARVDERARSHERINGTA